MWWGGWGWVCGLVCLRTKEQISGPMAVQKFKYENVGDLVFFFFKCQSNKKSEAKRGLCTPQEETGEYYLTAVMFTGWLPPPSSPLIPRNTPQPQISPPVLTLLSPRLPDSCQNVTDWLDCLSRRPLCRPHPRMVSVTTISILGKSLFLMSKKSCFVKLRFFKSL